MKNLLNSCRKTSSQFSKLILRVLPMFEGNFFFLEILQIFFVLSVYWLIYLHFWMKFFGRVSETEFYVPGDLFEEALDVRTFFSNSPLSSDLREIFRTSVDNCSAVLSKLHSLCERNQLREKLFWKNIWSLNNFGTSRSIFSDTRWEFLAVPSNSHFKCPKKHFVSKYNFQTKFFSIRFWTLSKTNSDVWRKASGHVFQNCNYFFTATSSWLTFSSKKRYFSLYLRVFLSRIFSVFWHKVYYRVDKSAF